MPCRFSRGSVRSSSLTAESVALRADCSLVRSGAHCTMASTPSPDRVRLTISVTPEVHAAFTRLSKASSVPIGRAMGEWLADTLDAVEFTAKKVEEARTAPRVVMREIHAYALGLVDETQAVLQGLRSGVQRASKAEPPRAAPLPPRPVIRGGKSPRKTLSPPSGRKS